MTIEQKAKAYDKALEKIKYVMEHGVQPVLNKEDLQDIFPELAESEDERTRKDIIHFVQSRLAGFPECERFVAWLEKQGEQKPKWKQSDNIRFSQLYDFLVNKTPRLQVDCNEYAAWLNSLKQRMQ